VYFLSEEERARVLKDLIPTARRIGVADELRGWNWHEPPLAPLYEVPIAMYEVAGKYCDSGRDVYLRRVEKVRGTTTPPLVRGSALHEVVKEAVIHAKQAIYSLGLEDMAALVHAVTAFESTIADKLPDTLTPAEQEQICREATQVAGFEARRLATRIEEAASKHPHIHADTLAALAIPVVVEHRLDGSYLGLSSHIRTDAQSFGQVMIIDLKFGGREPFHRLSTTGYSMVMESLFGYPVDLGCTVYVTLDNNRLAIERDLHLIDDELRQWFVEERDEKMYLIYEELDPGLASRCSAACPFASTCWPEGLPHH